MGVLSNPALWAEDNFGSIGATPPENWEKYAADDRWWFANFTESGGGEVQRVIYIGDKALIPDGSVLAFDWEVMEAPDFIGLHHFVYSWNGGVNYTTIDLPNTVGTTGHIEITAPAGWTQFRWGIDQAIGLIYTGVTAVAEGELPEPEPEPEQAWNCDCVDEREDRTLAELRYELLLRLGFAAQADNPPPGMLELLDSFLQSAQRILYRKYEVLRTERYFRWVMVPGQRFYGIRADDGDDICDLRLDPYKVRWVGIEDLNGSWSELACGIPSQSYTSIYNDRRSRPERYEIRQCIELFPPPDQAYALRIKGMFGLQPFTEDDDQTTIDSETVFLHALGTAKRHYRHPDAPDYFNQLTDYMGSLTSGAHHTRRYVPGAKPSPDLPRPRMDVFLDGDGNPE